MLTGGLFWGILSDKRGRLSTLYGSILLYSLANIANGFVDTVEWYATWRFIAGVGLAGELGAGITLVAETSPKESRGIATAMVASVGMMGAVLGGVMSPYFDWRTLYFIGGGLGLFLLVLRISAAESGMYKNTREAAVSRGNFFQLFKDPATFTKYLACILVGLPIWFETGILLTYAAEFGKALGVNGLVVSSTAVACGYGGAVFGDLSSGFLCQWFQNRKKAMLVYIIASLGLFVLYCNAFSFSLLGFYILCFCMGLGAGFWILVVTMAAEQFGTNIRGTVTTTVPNFIRGALVPMSLLFLTFKADMSILTAALYTGAVVYVLTLSAWWVTKDTFHKDLNYHE